MSILLRDMCPDDAHSVNLLSVQLGYPLSAFETEDFIKQVLSLNDNYAFVALDGERIIGWIHAFKAVRIESPPFIEIAGLVVDQDYRGKGVGKLLVVRIKELCLEKNIRTLRLRTNTKRADAHRFYERIGFVNIKDQKIYEMYL